MNNPIEAALARNQPLDNPNIMKEDTPPMLRFARETLEDRMITEETGRFGFRDVIKVYVRAFGDQKTEVPDVVWTKIHVPVFENVAVRKRVPVLFREPNESGVMVERTIYEERDTMEERRAWQLEERWPWFAKLDEKLRNGQISQGYRDHCRKAFAQWKEHGDVPLEGSPVVEWNQISPAQQQTLVNLGFKTIESVAKMTEEALTAFGMGGRDVKKKAENWLKADDRAAASAQIVRLETNLNQEQDQRKSLEAKVKALEERIIAQAEGTGKRLSK